MTRENAERTRRIIRHLTINPDLSVELISYPNDDYGVRVHSLFVIRTLDELLLALMTVYRMEEA